MNRTGSVICVFLAVVCLSLSAGCSKSRVELAVASQPNVNPDYSDRPSPVIVKIYELRNDLAFKQAEFTTLFDTPLQVLGADLVAADELVFIPGEARRVAYKPNPNTQFVGLVAGFRQMDRALWRVIKPVDPEEENWFAFELNDATLLVIPDKEAEAWDPEKAVRQFQQQLDTPRPPTETTASQKAAPTQTDSKTPPSSPSALDDPAREAGAHAEQGAKETVTIINPQGAETLPGGTGTVPASAPPATPGVSSPSLPSMRQF